MKTETIELLTPSRHTFTILGPKGTEVLANALKAANAPAPKPGAALRALAGKPWSLQRASVPDWCKRERSYQIVDSCCWRHALEGWITAVADWS